jgi:hypothetical protein
MPMVFYRGHGPSTKPKWRPLRAAISVLFKLVSRELFSFYRLGSIEREGLFSCLEIRTGSTDGIESGADNATFQTERFGLERIWSDGLCIAGRFRGRFLKYRSGYRRLDTPSEAGYEPSFRPK